MIYVIDHNDSFTHNVVHQFALFDKVECDNYDKINENKIKNASTIIFSPGPGNPKNYPITSKIYKKYKGKKKIIGICLGFQHILFCEGAKKLRANVSCNASWKGLPFLTAESKAINPSNKTVPATAPLLKNCSLRFNICFGSKVPFAKSTVLLSIFLTMFDFISVALGSIPLVKLSLTYFLASAWQATLPYSKLIRPPSTTFFLHIGFNSPAKLFNKLPKLFQSFFVNFLTQD